MANSNSTRSTASARKLEEAMAEALRAELSGLRVMALHARATASGVSAESIETAMDGDEPKPALVELIVERQRGASGVAAGLAGSRSERAAAYTVLESTEDAALGAACVEALAAVRGKPAAEVDAAELRHTGLVLARLAQLDRARIGGEFFKEGRFMSAFTKGTAFDAMWCKSPLEMTKEDARTLAAMQAWVTPACAGGFTTGGSGPLDVAGMSMGDWAEAV